jgi:hypothetical protein
VGGVRVAEPPFVENDPRLAIRPFYFQIVRAPSGAWCIQLHDIQTAAMGLVSNNRAPVCYESVLQADIAGRKLGLRPLRGE